MTYALLYRPHFLRRLEVLLKRNPSLRKRFEKTLGHLETNPYQPLLRTHKIVRRNGDSAFSSRVTRDLRVIWEFSAEQVHALDLLDTGGHEGARKVYR